MNDDSPRRKESAVGKAMSKTCLVSLALILSCGCGGLPSPHPGSHRAAREFLLRYKSSPGEEHQYLLQSSFSSHALGEEGGALSVKHEAKFRQNVLRVLPEGTAKLKVVIDKLKFVMAGPGPEVAEFNSDDPVGLNRCPEKMRGIAFFARKEMEIERAASGGIAGISGLTRIYTEALTELSLNERQPVERLLREMAHKPSALLGLDVIFPPGAIRVGEGWSAERGPFPIFCGRLAYHCNYLLREVSGGQAIVEFRGEPVTVEVQPASKMQQVKKAEVQGVLSFDLDRGILTKMHGESSSFLLAGRSNQLRTRVTWELTLQELPRGER